MAFLRHRRLTWVQPSRHVTPAVSTVTARPSQVAAGRLPDAASAGLAVGRRFRRCTRPPPLLDLSLPQICPQSRREPLPPLLCRRFSGRRELRLPGASLRHSIHSRHPAISLYSISRPGWRRKERSPHPGGVRATMTGFYTRAVTRAGLPCPMALWHGAPPFKRVLTTEPP